MVVEILDHPGVTQVSQTIYIFKVRVIQVNQNINHLNAAWPNISSIFSRNLLFVYMKCPQSSSKDHRSQGYASNRQTSRCEKASPHIINSRIPPCLFPLSQSLRGWLTYSIKKINIKQEGKCVLSLSDWQRKKREEGARPSTPEEINAATHPEPQTVQGDTYRPM